MKNHNSFRFYLRTNVYVLIISVIIINYFYITFVNQSSIEDPYRGIERAAGFFTGSAGWHGLAHYSLLTIFLISFYKPITTSRIEKYILSFSFLIACYLIFKSGTRTVYLGLISFMFIWFLLKKRYVWLLILVIGIYLLFLFNNNFHASLIEFDPHQTNFEEMGSGRGGIWEGFIRIFFMQPWFNILFGTGTQLVSIESLGLQTFAMAGEGLDAHNDYLLILFQIGIFSLFVFLSFYFSLFIKAIRLIKSDVGKLYIAMLVSVALMNFVSNAYISRINIAMIFWPLFVPLINKDILIQQIEGLNTCKA
jgi:O-antigen ligase